jgi:hypothetical protein
LNRYFPCFASTYCLLIVDSKVLGAIFGETVHFHLLKACDAYMKVLSKLEDKYLEPVRPDCKEFQELDTNWISETGIHFGWDTENEDIVFAARIM